MRNARCLAFLVRQVSRSSRNCFQRAQLADAVGHMADVL
jgi:hypothetical protein